MTFNDYSGEERILVKKFKIQGKMNNGIRGCIIICLPVTVFNLQEGRDLF